MSEYIFDVPDSNQPIAGDTALYYPDERDDPMMVCEEIVRCRDCKHYELLTVSYSDKPLSVCTAEWCEGMERDNPLVEPDGFCAWGERREQ